MNKADHNAIKALTALIETIEFKATTHAYKSNTAAVSVRLADTPEFLAVLAITNRLTWAEDKPASQWRTNDQ